MQQQTGQASGSPVFEHHNPLTFDGVVENVMRFLTQSERLRVAGLVCSRWQAAAVAVTAEEGVVLSRCGPAAEAWLSRHGATLQALVVKGGRLCADGPTSSLAALCQLTRLDASDLMSKPVLLASIGQCLTALRHLGLHNVCWGPLISKSSRRELAEAASRLWEGCCRLTHLQIEQCDFDDECVRSLSSCLHSLRALDLSNNALEDPLSLGQLPLGLTALGLGRNSIHLDVSHIIDSNSSSTGGGRTAAAAAGGGGGAVAVSTAAQSTSSSGRSAGGGSLQELQVLSINDVSLGRPALLAAQQQLTWLDVGRVNVPDLGELLAALPHLLQLRVLKMSCRQPNPHPAVRLSALQRALQPLTQLTELQCSKFTIKDVGDASAAGHQHSQQAVDRERYWFHGLQFPNLQDLTVDCIIWSGHRGPVFTRVDLEHLAAACPKLARLDMWSSVALESAEDLGPLTALAATLTSLAMDGDSQLQDAHMQDLAQLKRLQHLAIDDVGALLSDKGLLVLTSLTELTGLQLTGMTFSNMSDETMVRAGAHACEAHALELHTKVNKKGHATSVSQQLKELCADSPQLWREAQSDMTEQLKAARKAAKDAMKEAAAERKKALAAQKQAHKAQQQAAAAQDEVAALRQQLEALQLQLKHSQQGSEMQG